MQLQYWQVKRPTKPILATGSSFISLAVVLSALLCGGVAQAQDVGAVLYPPTYKSIDQNGVDLISGSINKPFSMIAIGSPENGLSRVDISGERDSNYLSLQITYGFPGNDPVKQDKSFIFQVTGEGWSDEFDAKDTLSYPFDETYGATLDAVGNNLQYTSRNGDVIVFKSDSCGSAYCASGGTRRLPVTTWTKPDGEVLTYHPGTGTISSNAGWLLKYDDVSAGVVRWTAVNTAVEPNYCDVTSTLCSFAGQWPSVSYSYPAGGTMPGNYSISDGLSRISNAYEATSSSYMCDGNGGTASETLASYAFTSAAGENVSYSLDGAYRVRSLTNFLGTWTYQYSDSTGAARNCDNKQAIGSDHIHTVTVTDPAGKTRIITSSTRYGRILSVTDELNRTTTYSYSGESPRPMTVVFPEQNENDYEYVRASVSKITYIPKPGSGLASTSVSAGYDATCGSPAKCNKPNWTKDALGNETDYAYDNATGLLLTVTKPADSSGVRPITANSYQQIATFSRNSAGGLSQTGAIWKITAAATCQKTAGSVVVSGLTSTLTCAGGLADLMLTTTSYDGSVNALPTSVTRKSGDGSLSETTSYGYNGYGDHIWVDGPRADVDDKHYTTYDVLRRPIYEIGPIPGGTGTQKRTVVRHQYDYDGREIETDQGYANSNAVDGSDAIFTSYKRMTYDAAGRLIKSEAVATGNAVP